MYGEKQEFAIIIAENFNEIRNNFKIGLSKLNYYYDEDVLSDVFIKCNSIMKDKLLTKQEAIKYFWVAYINTLKNNLKKQPIYKDKLQELNIITEEYNNDIDYIYNYIMCDIINEFGKDIAYAWRDYICKYKTYKELVETGRVGTNFNYILKKIKKHIKTDILGKNDMFNEILNNIRTA